MSALAKSIFNAECGLDDLIQYQQATEGWVVQSSAIDEKLTLVRQAVEAGDTAVIDRICDNPTLLARVLASAPAHGAMPLLNALDQRDALGDIVHVASTAEPEYAPFAHARAAFLKAVEVLVRVFESRRAIATLRVQDISTLRVS